MAMTTDRVIRASDHDRENVVEVLRDAYAAGRLTLAEFDERTTAAYSGKTWNDLRELTADLPVEPRLGADLPSAAVGGQTLPGSIGPSRPGGTGSLRAGAELPRGDTEMPRYGRRPVFMPLLPLALVWLAIATAARAPEALIPAVLVLLVYLRIVGRFWHGRGRDGPGGGSGTPPGPPGGPSRRADGPA
jgi:hypothetical protein